ncbi:cAMP-binding domain of CRP or a regulatory subunit of cAMP-dependent protein kinases [Filimonas lacunae]|uniref:cAMP-binding domain of CRP or a regulatory subunit of cAMP-dependent protein kinases n=1 Tax=Filimonas lacunae TaxID=477680 RepID=A0A173MIF6_9BACT|nr:Crp/Fnr family transcriptional regulator [Filimonas lacunae]BAV07256.1 Crp/Fnr family transcriptional regulator [Filimonas lacunae]SIS92479.1 cAMP-binding domain of CRP or a regulatory subunit of cAMP-dependent protein kinases [Filimonas lacunae]
MRYVRVGIMQNHHQKLLSLLESLVRLDASDKEMVIQYFEPVQYKAGELLVKPGGIAHYMYFINEGYLRTYSLADATEITHHINCPMGFITAYSSYTTRQPSVEYLHCITDCELLRIASEQLTALFQQNAAWAEAGRIINERVVTYNEKRSRDLVGKTAEQRYRDVIESHPDYLQNVPLQYIASFIGVKPESLSRIRRGIMK